MEENTNATITAPVATATAMSISDPFAPLSIAACLAVAATTENPAIVKATETINKIAEMMVAIKIINAHTDNLFFAI